LSRPARSTEQLPYDPVFFCKVDVFPGAVLTYLGRTQPGSRWVVASVQSDFGKQGYREVLAVRHLADYVTLRHEGTGETKQATFGYLSYSAIWRLA
jgi:hypothetical protein